MILLLAAFLLEANGELMEKTPGDTPEEPASYWVGIINEGRQYPAGSVRTVGITISPNTTTSFGLGSYGLVTLNGRKICHNRRNRKRKRARSQHPRCRLRLK